MSAPSWQLGEDRPYWDLSDLREEQPRIKQVKGPIYRTVDVSPLIERSAAAAEAPILSVTFAVFDTWTEIRSAVEGHFLEKIQRGSFAKTVKESLSSIKAVLSHGKDPSMGETVLGTIERIEETHDAAIAHVRLFPSVPQLLIDGLKAGVYGASFRGTSVKDKVDWNPGKSEHNPQGLPEVTRVELRLRDLGPTSFPAYPGTGVTFGGE